MTTLSSALLRWEPVAQLVERLTFNEDVHGSSPCGLTIPPRCNLSCFNRKVMYFSNDRVKNVKFSKFFKFLCGQVDINRVAEQHKRAEFRMRAQCVYVNYTAAIKPLSEERI